MIDWNNSTYAEGAEVVSEVLPDLDRRIQRIERSLGWVTLNYRGEAIDA